MTKLIVAFRNFAEEPKNMRFVRNFRTRIPNYTAAYRRKETYRAKGRGRQKFPFQPRRKTRLLITFCDSYVCHSFVLGKNNKRNDLQSTQLVLHLEFGNGFRLQRGLLQASDVWYIKGIVHNCIVVLTDILIWHFTHLASHTKMKEIALHVHRTHRCISLCYQSICRGAKSLARPGRKQANVSVTMAWISFGSLPCRGKENLITARVSMLLKSRASLIMLRACFLPGRTKDLSAPRYVICTSHQIQIGRSNKKWDWHGM